MASKSFPTTNSVQCWRSSKRLGRHTDPINYTDGSKTTSKRKSEESLERASKRSRTSQSPTAGCKHSSGPSTSVNNSGAVLVKKTSSKRKSTHDETEEHPRKRMRGTSSPTVETSSSAEPGTSSSVDTPSPDSTGETSGLLKHSGGAVLVKKTSSKRKSTHDESAEQPRKRMRGTSSPTVETSSSAEPGTSSSVDTPPPHSRAAFLAKYEQGEQLGEGGFGAVFAGHRKCDRLPVAIKRIDQADIELISVRLDGKICSIPLEVALLMRLKSAAAVVTLLDWYYVDNDLVLVLERPVPCLDLTGYLGSRWWSLQEHDMKAIIKQLVDALIDVHSRGVCHRDIKPDNILIETGSRVPLVRLIDFGCGTFHSGRRLTAGRGTRDYTSPELFQRHWYMAEPYTVWQLGVVLFVMLHGYVPFNNSHQVISVEPRLREGLSPDCCNFLQSCLNKCPETRPTLMTLKNHPWLV